MTCRYLDTLKTLFPGGARTTHFSFTRRKTVWLFSCSELTLRSGRSIKISVFHPKTSNTFVSPPIPAANVAQETASLTLISLLSCRPTRGLRALVTTCVAVRAFHTRAVCISPAGRGGYAEGQGLWPGLAGDQGAASAPTALPLRCNA